MSSKSRSRAADASDARLTNVVGAWSLAVADRVTAAAAAAAGRGGQAPAALVALHEFAGGSTIDHLRQVLGISHSATVRLIDGLDVDGYVKRAVHSDDRRSVALTLTPKGRQTARQILEARYEAVHSTLAGLSDEEQQSLVRLADVLTAQLANVKLGERADGRAPAGGWLCRLCDFDACGRPEGLCPAARQAHARTEAAE